MAADQLVSIDFETLGSLRGGAYNRQLRKLLTNLFQDMQNRPSENRERTLNIKLKLKPKTAVETNPQTDREEIVLTGANLRLEWGVSVPSRKSEDIDVGFSIDGDLLVNPAALHNHRQMAFPEMSIDANGAGAEPPSTLQLRQVDVRDTPDRRTASAGG